MNNQRFDDLTRRIGRALRGEHSRRTVLRGAGATIAAGGATVCGLGASPATRGAARQEATPASDPLVQQIAFDLEYDLEKIFRFVADEIGYETYNGALRGVRGTLWSRAGNSVDKAQLLKALLDESLIETRFVIGELPEADAVALAEVVGVMPERSEVLANAIEAPGESGTADVQPTSVPEVEMPVEPEELFARLADLRAQLFAEATASMEADVELITGLLSEAGVDIPTHEVALARTEREQHIWLQARQGPEWLDLDPSFAGIEPGDAPAAAAETPAELAEELFHTVTFRIIVETAAGDTTEEQTLLDYTVRSQSLVGEDLLIMHVEPESLEAIGTSITEALGGEITYYPLIVLGDEGYLADVPIKLGGGGGVQGEDVFGSGEAGAAAGEALAERYEIEIRSPGLEPVTISRMLFDRIPIAQRSTGTIALEDIPKVEEIELGNDERGVLDAKKVIALATVVSAVEVTYLAQPAPENAPISSYTRAIHTMHGIRDSIMREQPDIDGIYIDRPNITTYTVTPIPNPDGGNPNLRIDADLLHQSFAYGVSLDGAPAGILAGTLAQSAERLALEPRLFDTVFDAGFLPIRPELSAADVTRVFAAARNQEIALTVLSPDDREATTGVDVSRSVETLLRAHLSTGKHIIVPEEMVEIDGAPTIAWWVYDSATGKLVDYVADGRSGATIRLGPMGEYAVELWAFTKTAKGMVALGVCIFSNMQVVGAVMNLNPRSTAGDIVGLTGAAGAGWGACTAYFAAGAI